MIQEKTILVIGGTGMLGLPVCETMKKNKWEVHVLTRNVEKAEKINKKYNCYSKIIKGSLSEESYFSALGEVNFVHVSLSGTQICKMMKMVIEGIKKVKEKDGHEIKRLSFLSQHHWKAGKVKQCEMMNLSLENENMIKESGIEYCIFRPSWFMESLPLFVEKGKVKMWGNQTMKMGWISATDYANLVLTSYSTKYEESKNKTFEVQGEERLSMEDALMQYQKDFYPKTKKISCSGLWIANFFAFLASDKELKLDIGLLKFMETATEEIKNEETVKILGKCSISLSQWMKEYHSKEYYKVKQM